MERDLDLFLGNLLKKAIPILGKAIKGAAKAAVPHLQDAAVASASNFIESAVDKIPSKRGKKIIQEVGKRALQEVVNIDHLPLTNEELKDCNVKVHK